MTTPHFPSLAAAIHVLFGGGTQIEAASRISGGDINEAHGLTLTNGECIFMKSNRKENFPFFEAEAAGLSAIARTKAIGTPCIDEILIEPEYPSLLHGDLWSGNVITGNDGSAWLIDPAVYVGHAEADLAMTELFGGFPPVFYDAYKTAAPLQPGYERRRDVYNLYHLLNHLNMFGRIYLSEVKRIMGRF